MAKGIMTNLFSRHPDTILIAQPDQVLRQMEYRVLSASYRIIRTSSVEEAVRTAARHATKIDLLLTEVRLPHRFGWELTELLKLDYPGLKVLYLANTIDAEIAAHTHPSMIVLPNPFRPDTLRQAVRDALEAKHEDRIAHIYAYSPPILPLRP
jgi:DNA-binding NtrC family response regulator